MRSVVTYSFFIGAAIFMYSCHTTNKAQISTVKEFAGTSKVITELPYNLLFNYYTIEFKRKQLSPEIYVTGRTKEELDDFAENVISQIEDIRKDYLTDLETTTEVKTTYDLLQTYFNLLERLSDNKYSENFDRRSEEMVNKMSGLVLKFNAGAKRMRSLPVNPNNWLTLFLTQHGRTNLRKRQTKFLKEYIAYTDTLVQTINQNFHDYQVPFLKEEFDNMGKKIRNQFKRTLTPYLQYIALHGDSTATITSIEFYSKIIPVYYGLLDDIQKNQLMIQVAESGMNELAFTHRLMKNIFDSNADWNESMKEIDQLKEKVFAIRDLFNKSDQERFSYYKNFILER